MIEFSDLNAFRWMVDNGRRLKSHVIAQIEVMKLKTKLTQQEQEAVDDFHKAAVEAEKDLSRIMTSPESFPSLVLIDTHPTHFGTSDTKSCRSLTIFGINNGIGQTVVVFKDRSDRSLYSEKSKLVKRIQRRGGRVLESQFHVNLKQVLQLIPATYKSPRYKQVVEKYNNSSSLDGIRSLLEKRKTCREKTRTFACFFHLQELSSVSEMALFDHIAGKSFSFSLSSLFSPTFSLSSSSALSSLSSSSFS